MVVLAIGDVVGSVGCKFLRSKLPALKKLKQVDLCIANGENSADGNGITPMSAEYLFKSGVDIITTGNHSFRRKESYSLYDECEYLVRPANYPPATTPGRGICYFETLKAKVAIINIMGAIYMDSLACPLNCADELIQCAKDENANIILIDFHAEATSEKRALGYYLDGRVSAVFGTHTHVQTADETILPNGTGYITDLGMTGTIHSVLGVKSEIIIKMLKEKLPQRFDLADGECKMDCIIYEIDDKTGKTLFVERMSIV